MSIRTEQLQIPVVGDSSVTGTLWLSLDEPSAALTIHPATATPERFYRGLAEYFAARGYAVVTYDFRGTGRSGKPKDHPELRMRDWMAQDVPAVASWVRSRFGDLPQVAIGHSVGAHALALDYGTEGLAGFVTISSHAGVTSTVRGTAERRRVAAVLHVAGPVLCRVFGYMPGRRAGLGEDMPSGAMLEWGKWARKPHYFFDDPSMDAAARTARVSVPVLAVGASDDPWATPEQIEEITDRLTGTTVERRTFTPGELGVSSLGHHGLVRRSTGRNAWPALERWLSGVVERGASI
ncbi:alpha/beta fold hydrolase [Kocuria carniphila]|uniref:alpha/beta hydrolase family protein n=1 Tax=Kocuria carniphila TaxID=262208 RepID=UPI0021A7B78E|nr:alpha/beta fold hydrolase [Kocuria carniphila]MCT1801247.1 alpha/beta fold hydrolase [Kocuria carniphila]